MLENLRGRATVLSLIVIIDAKSHSHDVSESLPQRLRVEQSEFCRIYFQLIELSLALRADLYLLVAKMFNRDLCAAEGSHYHSHTRYISATIYESVFVDSEQSVFTLI